AAVATTRLYEEQAKTSEERRFLAEASAILASSLDYETTLKNVASLSVPQFADWCAVDVVRDAGTVERLTIAHADPAQVRRADAHSVRSPSSRRGATTAAPTSRLQKTSLGVPPSRSTTRSSSGAASRHSASPRRHGSASACSRTRARHSRAHSTTNGRSRRSARSSSHVTRTGMQSTSLTTTAGSGASPWF